MTEQKKPIADEIESEQRALIEAQGRYTSVFDANRAAQDGLRVWGWMHRKPMEEDETITKWLARYFDEKPCYPYGSPVAWRDEVTVETPYDSESGTLQGIHYNSGPVKILSFVGVDHERLVRYNPETDTLKRPTPPAPDADGVNTCEGDTVYIAPEHEHDCGKGLSQLHGEAGLAGVKYGKPYEVRSLYEHNGQKFARLANLERPWCPVSWLTHCAPDSFEKLRDDICEMAEASADGASMREWSDRLTALIERG